MKAPLSNRSLGFTLLELLVVMGIIALLMGVLLPALTRKSTDFTTSVYKIDGLLEQARAYAMAHNTFVWVGFTELDGAAEYSTTALTSGTGIGRVVVATIASRDGLRGYDITTSPLNSPACWTAYSGADFIAVGKLEYFTGLHLANLGTPPTSGNMARYDATATVGGHVYNIADSTCTSVTPFKWPLGEAASSYNFYKVINFDPQGVARIQYSNSKDSIVPYIEIGLVPARGNVALTSGTNKAAIQIDCMSGASCLYRP